MSPEPLPDLTALRALCEAAAGPGDFTRAEARQLGAAALILVKRREQNRSGSAPDTPTTDDGKLVAAARAALGAARGRPFTQGELADKLGIGRANQTMLSPKKLGIYGLVDDERAKLLRWIAGAP